jgi:hypothetical protein
LSLPGLVEGAVPSVLGFDSDTTISFVLAEQFFQLGYKFCVRYLSLGEQSPEDLSDQEAADILNSGLALMPVQHTRDRGWFPNQSLGERYGQSAGANAQSVGFPAGVNVWCDLEGVNPSAPAQEVMDYCEAWHEAVNAAGYVPGVYVGSAAGLTGQQLYELPFEHYWRSPSDVPDIPTRGYQLLQLYPSISVNGILIDIDVGQNDRLGGHPLWLRAGAGSLGSRG